MVIVREVTKKLMVIVPELQRSCVTMGETSSRTTITEALQRSELHSRGTRLKPLVSERYMAAPEGLSGF